MIRSAGPPAVNLSVLADVLFACKRSGLGLTVCCQWSAEWEGHERTCGGRLAAAEGASSCLGHRPGVGRSAAVCRLGEGGSSLLSACL